MHFCRQGGGSEELSGYLAAHTLGLRTQVQQLEAAHAAAQQAAAAQKQELATAQHALEQCQVRTTPLECAEHLCRAVVKHRGRRACE